MPIELACPSCSKQYRVPDHFAGQAIPCKQCGNDIDVPDEEGNYASTSRRSPRRSGKKKSRAKSGMPWMIIGGGLGAVGVIGIILAIVLSRPASPPVNVPGTGIAVTPITTPTSAGGAGTDPATTPNSTPAPGPVAQTPATPPPTPKSNADYEKNLAKQALQRAYDAIKSRFTAPKSAIVIINGVEGVESEADHYLERKLFKAAYAEYEAGQKTAQQMTEANRQQAEQQAKADHDRQWGGAGFGTVWYRYKPVYSDVPYPEVKGGSNGNGQYVYYVGPASDLSQLASRLSIGSVASTDNGNRTLTITAALPVPIPDIDVEEMIIQHGKESVVSIIVEDAQGEPDRVSYYLESKVKELGGENNRLVMVGPRQTAPGRVQFWVGPVKNVNDVAAGITFGKISDLDPQQQIITVAADIPSDLPPRPTPRELAEIERKKREGDLNPKDGEEEIDWAIRVLKKGEPERRVLTKVLGFLASTEVDPAKQDAVAAALIVSISDDTHFWFNGDEYMPALNAWYEKKIAKRLIAMLHGGGSRRHHEKILEVLANHPSPESAQGIASMMDNFFLSKQASLAMREMGVHAEDVLLKHITHQDAKVRFEIYDILAEQGTKKSLGKLKGNIVKERDAEMKQILKDAIDRLQTRLKDSASTGDDDKSEK